MAERDFYRKSMIDYVLDDANRLRDRVAKADQRKLDQYLTGVREVERRIQNADRLGGPARRRPAPGPRASRRTSTSTSA